MTLEQNSPALTPDHWSSAIGPSLTHFETCSEWEFSATFEAVFGALDSAALLVHTTGDLLAVNTVSSALLGICADRDRNTNFMTLLDGPSRQRWQSAMTQVLAGHAPTVRLKVNGCERLASLCLVARRDGDSDAILVLFGRESIVPMTVRAFLETECRLTRAECDVTSGVCRGLSPKEIARQRGVSLATVRAQIRSVLSKTGVSSTAALIAWIARIPSISIADIRIVARNRTLLGDPRGTRAADTLRHS